VSHTPSTIVQEYIENSNVYDSWGIALQKTRETSPTLEIESHEETMISNRTEDEHEQLVNECIKVLNEGKVAPLK